jgi:hypothetical protein
MSAEIKSGAALQAAKLIIESHTALHCIYGAHNAATVETFSYVPALNRNRFSRLIDRDQRKDAMCDAKFLARHETRHPNLDGDGH